MMIVPIDADVDVTEQVDQRSRDDGPQSAPIGSVGDLYFKHHDSDDDCNHAIAERLHPPLVQMEPPVSNECGELTRRPSLILEFAGHPSLFKTLKWLCYNHIRWESRSQKVRSGLVRREEKMPSLQRCAPKRSRRP